MKQRSIGIIGAGKIGLSLGRRARRAGWNVWAWDVKSISRRKAARSGLRVASSLKNLMEGLAAPRLLWLMLPAASVEECLRECLEYLKPRDIVIDGGNSFYGDSMRREKLLSSRKIDFLDVGVSGGILGETDGYCLMAGGRRSIFRKLTPLFNCLSADGSYLYCGGHGAGHYAKMAHNAIEYGLLQSYADGFALLAKGPYRFPAARLAEVWCRSSLIRSRLLELCAKVLRRDAGLAQIRNGSVEDTGEGRWAVAEAIRMGLALPAAAAALFQRFDSRTPHSFSRKLIKALRHEFGGHRA